MWKQKDADRILVEIAVTATILFAFLATRIRQNSKCINLLFIIIVSCSLYICSFWLEVHLYNLPVLFYKRIFNGTDERYYLLLFYWICIFATLIFCIIVNRSSYSSTIHRKFFHLTVSLICITGIQYDFELIWLSAWLMLCIFIIIEVFRSKCVSPWSKYLNGWLLIFIDKQDSPELILTPIYLLAGIFLPIFLSPINNNEYRHLYHFAGVATVGVGDSLSSIIGSLYGRLHWPKSRKTLEGSIAFAIGQFIFLFLINMYYLKCDIETYQLFWILFCSVICAFFEAMLPIMDNLILPVIAYLILF
uniref:dolichol kinase n=1 Tax=Onchocerca volvulus TaxID=6282 RepID=A0A8R1U1S4_ONCVO